MNLPRNKAPDTPPAARALREQAARFFEQWATEGDVGALVDAWHAEDQARLLEHTLATRLAVPSESSHP